MVRTLRITVALVLAITSQVFGQSATPAPTVLAIDINKGTFSWQWPGTADPSISFRVTCTDANNVATSKDVPSSQLSLPVNQELSAGGTYTCAVIAFNQFGPSAPSNAVTFSAGTPPAAPTGLVIQAK